MVSTMKMIPISRVEAESAIPPHDCSGRLLGEDEREDLIRSVLLGAEMQRGEIQIRTEKEIGQLLKDLKGIGNNPRAIRLRRNQR